MARPIKEDLDYFPFDVDFFSDKKIKRLRASYGNDGICVYIYILCMIYGDKGYYTEYDEDLILDISDELNISENLTRQIADYLLSRSLFDDTLAQSVKVLSSTSVQRRYQEAKRGLKRDVFVKAKIWLLKKAETLSFIKVRPDDGLSRNNESFSEINDNKSEKNDTKERREKKSKENKSKVNVSDGEALLTDEQRQELVGLSSVGSVDTYTGKIIEWQKRSGKQCRSPYNTIRAWIEQDRRKQKNDKKPGDSSYDLDEFERFALNFRLSERAESEDKK